MRAKRPAFTREQERLLTQIVDRVAHSEHFLAGLTALVVRLCTEAGITDEEVCSILNDGPAMHRERRAWGAVDGAVGTETL
jgi:hypothetical protein